MPFSVFIPCKYLSADFVISNAKFFHFSRKATLTTLMITHNMRDAIRYGNRLIMMNEGHVIYDVRGEEKTKLEVSDLLQRFEQAGGEANDRMILS